MKHQLERAAGIHVAAALLRHKPERIGDIWFKAGTRNARLEKLRRQAAAAGVRSHELDQAGLDRLLPAVRHQGVVVSFEADNLLDEGDLEPLIAAAAEPLVVVLDGVTDPHNLGACLRTAEAAGATAVVIPRDRAAELTPAARRAAAGAAELLPLVRVVNLARALRRLKQGGLWLAGTAGEAAQTLYEHDLNRPLAVVLGAEEHGMRRLTAELCDFQMRIPLTGRVESLNVSVAAGVVLFEVRRQRTMIRAMAPPQSPLAGERAGAIRDISQ